MGLVRVRYVSTWVDWRTGVTRARFRYRGRSRMLPAPDDPAFWPAYQSALSELVERPDRTPSDRESLDWLLRAYQKSPEFRRLAPRTREDYRAMLGRIAELAGCKPWRHMTRGGIIKHIRDPLADSPRRADYAVSVLSSVCRWAVERDMLSANPCKGIRKLHQAGDGYRAWSQDEIERFLTHCTDWEWLVFALAFYTARRPGDLVTLTWFQYDGATFRVRQEKTRKVQEIEAHPVLRETLAQLPRTEGTILTGRHGAPLSRHQLSDRWKRAMRRMGLKGCTLHGLRTTNQKALAEAAANTRTLMAMSGHATTAMAERYTRNAEQRRLAASAVAKLPEIRRSEARAEVSTPTSQSVNGEEASKKGQ